MKGKLLSPEDVAERLAVNPATVRSWLRSGKLEGVKLGKRMWRVDESEVQALLCREDDVNYGVVEGGSVVLDNVDYRAAHKERIIENLDYLSSGSLAKIDSMVRDLREKETNADRDDKDKAYLRARRALSSIKGSLSDDITEERKERL